MQIISINLIVPERWTDLPDQHLRYVFTLIADEFNIDELKTLFLLQWSKLKVIGRQETGAYLLQKEKSFLNSLR